MAETADTLPHAAFQDATHLSMSKQVWI